MNDQTQAIVPLLLKANDAAKMLAISPRKLWQLTNCRDIRCVRIGGAVRYDPADLRSYIEKQKRKSTANQNLARELRLEHRGEPGQSYCKDTQTSASS